MPNLMLNLEGDASVYCRILAAGRTSPSSSVRTKMASGGCLEKGEGEGSERGRRE